ncbi:MAG: hypothetical protein GYA46_08405 [candidate division Zixibacteria bacterium]|nr:hypothetical protein [candidate division Zixibacteria bacterium]
MSNQSMNRKQFLTNVGKVCMGGCACALAASMSDLYAQENKSAPPPAEPPKSRNDTRMAFAEGWLTRFFTVFDENLDPATRKKIMMANGRACYLNWIKETNQQIKPITMERLKAFIAGERNDGSYQLDGDAILFQYMSAAETGQASDEGACLCALVETKPAGLSSTYCLCSVGYVKVMHEKLLGRPVEVELLDSVLMGGKRCKFKITVA